MEDNMSNIINNFKTILNNSNSNTSSSNTENTASSDFNISPEMLENLLNSFKNSNNTESDESSSNSSSSLGFDSKNGIDFETIIKIKSILETLNKKDDPRSNLLYSLKPYLRDTRRKKLDQYVNLFKITQVTNLLKNEKGDGK